MSTRLYTVPEAMEQMRVGRTLMYRLIRTGALKSVKVGGARRIPATALDEFIQSLLVQEQDQVSMP